MKPLRCCCGNPPRTVIAFSKFAIACSMAAFVFK